MLHHRINERHSWTPRTWFVHDRSQLSKNDGENSAKMTAVRRSNLDMLSGTPFIWDNFYDRVFSVRNALHMTCTAESMTHGENTCTHSVIFFNIECDKHNLKTRIDIRFDVVSRSVICPKRTEETASRLCVTLTLQANGSLEDCVNSIFSH